MKIYKTRPYGFTPDRPKRYSITGRNNILRKPKKAARQSTKNHIQKEVML